MMKLLWSTRRTDLIAGLALTILPALFYPLAATRHGVFYVGDIFRLYYPQRAVYADALCHGHLPLWTPDVLAGFPLLAEGQTGMFYPLNLLLYRYLPIDLALNYSILLALSLASVAMYALGRVLGLRPAAAGLAALTFAYSGFFVGHFNHLNIMAAAPWLPVELIIIEWVLRVQPDSPDHGVPAPALRGIRRDIALIVALGLALGVQFLAGHPQIWLMSTLVVLMYGLFRAIWPTTGVRRPATSAVTWLALVVAAVAVGCAVAAVQLLPTWELVQQSVRAGGLSEEFFTSFSWHPALLSTLIVPFALGNPYPNISVELAAYLGLVPLLLALSSLVLRRDRLTAFLAGLAGLALLLAFGDYTPLYVPLARVPVLNLFRVPARFLYVFTLAVALLAGRGLDALITRYVRLQGRDDTRISRAGLHRALTGTAFTPLWVVVAAAGIRMVSLDMLLTLRWALPAVMFLLTVGLLAGIWRQWLGRRAFAWAAIGLTLIDLYAFGTVYRRTYNDLMSVEEFYESPASLQFFPDEPSGYRILTHQAIVPALSVMRASLYPNISLLHGISSANGYFPLTPARHARYLAELTPGRLNLLNARYFVIPQLLPVDPETEQYDLHDPYMPDPVGAVLEIPPTHAEAVELTSFTSQSADWPQGQLVAQIVLTGDAGATVTLPVRAGVETAEWAYDRSDVVEQIAHERPPVARTWPARSGFPPEDHPGHAYRAQYRLPQPMTVTSVQVVPIRPAGLIHVEDLKLVGPKPQRSLAELLGLGRHQLVYRDPDVVVYENLDALPRTFVVEHARVVPDDATALSLIDDPDFDPCQEVLLADRLYTQQGGDVSAGEVRRAVSVEGPGLTSLCSAAVILEYAPHRVAIQAELEHPGYLVLLDSYYPGWRAMVDGRQAPILRADVLFRAVRLEPGRHQVTFVFDPFSYRIGKIISSMTLAGLVMALAWLLLRRLRTAGG